MSEPNLIDSIIPSLEQSILETGAFIKAELLKFNSDQIQYKGKNDMVSYVDITAEKMLKSTCQSLIPGSGFINEESEDEPSENGYTWIIDPLDGTTNFIHGIPHFSISLGLKYEDDIVLGYVMEPNSGDLFFARKGKGAFLNGKKISVSQTNRLSNSLVATGFPYSSQRIEDYVDLFRTVLSQSQSIRRFGSAALDLAWVACGRYEAFYEKGLNPWDLAAGTLLVSEAGGKVSDFTGGDNYLFGKQLISSNAYIHEELLNIFKERRIH